MAGQKARSGVFVLEVPAIPLRKAQCVNGRDHRVSALGAGLVMTN
jgi:hypothetical protein